MSPANDTRQRILDSARTLLHTRNYADVGVAEICNHADVRKGSFYHFFPSKRDLTLAALESGYQDLKHQLIERAFARDVTPMERLERFTQLTYQLQSDLHKETGIVPGCQFGNLAAEQSSLDEILRKKIASVFSKIESAIRDVLLEAVGAGEIGQIDVDATARAMFAYLEGVILMAKTCNDPELLKQLLPPMLEIRINGT